MGGASRMRSSSPAESRASRERFASSACVWGAGCVGHTRAVLSSNVLSTWTHRAPGDAPRPPRPPAPPRAPRAPPAPPPPVLTLLSLLYSPSLLSLPPTVAPTRVPTVLTSPRSRCAQDLMDGKPHLVLGLLWQVRLEPLCASSRHRRAVSATVVGVNLSLSCFARHSGTTERGVCDGFHLTKNVSFCRRCSRRGS